MRMPALTGGRRRVAILAGFAALTLALTAPLAWRGGSAGPVNTGDGQLSIWNVSWVARTLVLDPTHVYDANIFAPHESTLAFSEANLPAGVLGLPAWWLTRNPYAAYNSAVCLSLLLAALAAFGLVRHLTGSGTGAAVAAILFAFAPFVTVRYPHIQLLVTAGLPLTLWAMHRFVDQPTVRRALSLSLAMAFAGLSSGYYGFFAAIAAGIGMGYYGLARGTWRRPFYPALCGVAALGAGLMFLPFFLPYLDLLRGPQPFRTLGDASQYSATFRSYLTSASNLHRLVLGWLLPLRPVDFPERVLFPGFLACGLAAAAVVRALRRRPGGGSEAGTAGGSREVVGYYVLLAGVAAWFSFGPKAGLYAAAYRLVPAWSLLRAPSRFGALVALALAVLAGIAVASLTRASRRRAWVPAAIVLASVFDVAAVPWDARDALPVPVAYRSLAGAPAGTVAEFPFFFRRIDFHRNSLYMLYSTAHWHPLVNGYSDRIPDDYEPMVVAVSSFPSWEAFGILRRHGTRYVVFHLNLYDVRSREKLLERLDRYNQYLRPMVKQDDVWLFEIVEWPA
jgi:hypothetical protein